jgi:hypothetical protein
MIDVYAFNQTEQRGTLVNEITTVGVDLAKNVISVCGLDREGRVVLERSMSPNTCPRTPAWPDSLRRSAIGSPRH